LKLIWKMLGDEEQNEKGSSLLQVIVKPSQSQSRRKIGKKNNKIIKKTEGKKSMSAPKPILETKSFEVKFLEEHLGNKRNASDETNEIKNWRRKSKSESRSNSINRRMEELSVNGLKGLKMGEEICEEEEESKEVIVLDDTQESQYNKDNEANSEKEGGLKEEEEEGKEEEDVKYICEIHWPTHLQQQQQEEERQREREREGEAEGEGEAHSEADGKADGKDMGDSLPETEEPTSNTNHLSNHSQSIHSQQQTLYGQIHDFDYSKDQIIINHYPNLYTKGFWYIHDIHKYISHFPTSQPLLSPQFYSQNGNKWTFILYPNGYSHHSPNTLSLYLHAIPDEADDNRNFYREAELICSMLKKTGRTSTNIVYCSHWKHGPAIFDQYNTDKGFLHFITHKHLEDEWYLDPESDEQHKLAINFTLDTWNYLSDSSSRESVGYIGLVNEGVILIFRLILIFLIGDMLCQQHYAESLHIKKTQKGYSAD
jgi:hypothetical protein